MHFRFLRVVNAVIFSEEIVVVVNWCVHICTVKMGVYRALLQEISLSYDHATLQATNSSLHELRNSF